MTRFFLLTCCISICVAGCRQADRSISSETLPLASASQPAGFLPAIDSVNAPNIIFAAMEYDFGQMQPGTQKTAVFEFINAGDQDLELEHIRTCCGVAAHLPLDRVIPPGQASEISITYSAGLSSGVQKKRILLMTNDPQHKEVELWIQATLPEIKASASVNPPESEEKDTAASPRQDSLSKPVRQSIDFIRHSISR
ncbi:MAG: DUF1573 domain-containing protein [Clostridiales bacterium]|nr:DUF1573 domain-containing protein [Clostridiales bacterium]